MNRFLDMFLVKRHKLIVNEADVMIVLRMLDDVNRSSKIYTFSSMEIWKCDDITITSAWAISFRITNTKWRALIRSLKESKRRIVLDEDDKYYLV